MKARQRGASLLELMIALALGVLVTGALVMFYIHMARAAQYQQALAEIQATGRFATQLIAHDLRRAGFWGRAWQPSFVGAFTTSDAKFQRPARAGYGGTELFDGPLPVWGAPADRVCQASGCLGDAWGGEPQAPRDALFVRYARARDDSAAPLLESHGSCAWIGSASGGPCDGLDTDDHWRYYAVYYYLRGVQEPQPDGGSLNVPALYMAQLGALGQYRAAVEIVRNVEALAVEWGYDSDGDGAADRYYSSAEAGTQAQDDVQAWWQRVVSARLYLVVRSEALTAPRAGEAQTFALGSRTYSAPDDKRVRRLFSTTVTIRNARHP